MPLRWIPGQIENKKVWSEGLFTLSIRCPGVQHFEPGQFLQVGLSLEDKHLHRPYSVASPHADVLEFFIVRVDGGELTPRLWQLQPGDLIDVSEKATGSFTLSHSAPRDCLWLIGTGTGLAPYIAMLRDGQLWHQFQSIVLVHGVRFGTDLAYLDELDQIRHRYPSRFCFIPITSRDNVAKELFKDGLTGRITHRLDDGSLELAANKKFSAEGSTVMLCGNPDMLNDMEAMLERRGLEKQRTKHPGQIIVERYW